MRTSHTRVVIVAGLLAILIVGSASAAPAQRSSTTSPTPAEARPDADPEPRSQPEGGAASQVPGERAAGSVSAATATSPSTATIRGSVFYNDQPGRTGSSTCVATRAAIPDNVAPRRASATGRARHAA